MQPKKIAITGANGFIGERLTAHFLVRGHKVIGMSRSEIKNTDKNFSWLHYTLENPPDFEKLKQSDVIIHCAFKVWSEENPNADEININAANVLADLCQREGKQFVFLSSFSAHEFANSHYGRHKFQLENKFKALHLVIKPGMVIGARGLFSRLEDYIKTKKFIPIIGDGKQPVQWIRADELCEGIANAIEKNLKGVLKLASVKSITYLELLEQIAAANKRDPFFVFIPVFAAAMLLKIFGKRLPFTEENLKGLLQLREFDTREDLEAVNIKPNSKNVIC